MMLTFLLSGFFWVPIGFAICAMMVVAKRADESGTDISLVDKSE